MRLRERLTDAKRRRDRGHRHRHAIGMVAAAATIRDDGAIADWFNRSGYLDPRDRAPTIDVSCYSPDGPSANSARFTVAVIGQ